MDEDEDEDPEVSRRRFEVSLAVEAMRWVALRLGERDRASERRGDRIAGAFAPFLERVPGWLADGGEWGLWRDLGAALPVVRALEQAWRADPMSDETRRLAGAVTGTAALGYPTSSLRALDAETPRTVVERWRCRTADAQWTVAIEWTPPWLPTARLVRESNRPRRVRSSLWVWCCGKARTDLVNTLSGLHKYASQAEQVDVDVLRSRWADVPVVVDEVRCLRDGQPATSSLRISSPERIRGAWRVKAVIDGVEVVGTGRSPVFAVLSVLPSVTRDLARVRGLEDVEGFGEWLADLVPGGAEDLLPDAELVERWTARDGSVWPVAVRWPEDPAIACGGEVVEVFGADDGQTWAMAAVQLAELREQIGVVSAEVVRWPTGGGTWARWQLRVDEPWMEIVGVPRPVRGGAVVDLVVSVGADMDRREVHDLSPLLALVAAGEIMDARIAEWLAFS